MSIFIIEVVVFAYLGEDFFSSVGAGAGGLMMVVLFSTFFSSFAGGLMIVVSFSVTFSAGAVLTRESQAARRPKVAAIMMIGFIAGDQQVFAGTPALSGQAYQ